MIDTIMTEHHTAHIEKLEEISDYIQLSLYDYLQYAKLWDKECNKRYVIFLRVTKWFLKYLKRKRG